MLQFIKKKLSGSQYDLPERTLDDLKKITKILFVDDRKFEVTQILKSAGWTNTNRVTDVESLDSVEIRESHIIFIDISGVGKRLKFKDEGLGLIKALRQKYPQKKLIVYSAERTGDRFHPGLSAADERLSKNADPFEFQAIVEDFSKEAFSLSECAERLKDTLHSEFGVYLSKSEIIAKMSEIAKNRDTSEKNICKIFNLSNAGSIASIISLFFS